MCVSLNYIYIQCERRTKVDNVDESVAASGDCHIAHLNSGLFDVPTDIRTFSKHHTYKDQRSSAKSHPIPSLFQDDQFSRRTVFESRSRQKLVFQTIRLHYHIPGGKSTEYFLPVFVLRHYGSSIRRTIHS